MRIKIKIGLFSVLITLMLLFIFPLQRGYARIIDPAEQLEKETQQKKIQAELSHIPLQAQTSEDKGMRFWPFAGCLRIDRINISGDKLLRDLLSKKEKTYVSPYMNHCVSSRELNDLLIKLNTFLFEQGYVTARLEIEKYDKKTKELTVKVQEGRIEKFATTAINRYTAFPGLIGKELRIQDLDQGLVQLNRLPSQYSIATLWPGKEVGGTIVKVDTKKTGKPYRLYLSFDNTGYQRTGQNVLKSNFSYDNLFCLNDQLFLAGSKSGLGRGRSAAVTWKEEVPFGYYTLGYGGSYSDSQYDIYPKVKETELTINSLKNKLNLARTIYRDLNRHISLGTSFWHYIPHLEFAGSHRLKSIEQKLSVIEISAHYDCYYPVFRSLNEFNYAQGTRLFGATKNLQHSHAQFRCYKLTSDYLWKIADKIHLNGNMQIQYAEQGLPGIVQLSVLDEIGGIRGIRTNSLTSDDGIIFRHDLIFPSLFSVISPFLHVDIGWAKDKAAKNKLERYSSIGGGVKLNYLGFNAQGTISKLIDKPTFQQEIKREGWVILFELSQKFL